MGLTAARLAEPPSSSFYHQERPPLWARRLRYVATPPSRHAGYHGNASLLPALTISRNAGHALRHKSAGAFGPDLAKKLSILVKMEKNVMRSLETVARERMEVAVCHPPPHNTAPSIYHTDPDVPQQQLSIWGETGDEDVSDVTDKLGVLLYEIGELEDQYVDRYDQYRVTIKSIRNIEASVQPSRDRKQLLSPLAAGPILRLA